MKQRLQRLMKVGAILLFTGLIYACFYGYTGIGVPCIFHEVTGFLCPGCGVTRMCVSLLQFQLKEAFGYHPVLFCFIPIYIPIGVFQIYHYLRYGYCDRKKWLTIWYYITLVILVGFSVIRNCNVL